MNIRITQNEPRHREQNIVFDDHNADWKLNLPSLTDTTYNVADMNDTELGDFFSRPSLISTISWSPENDLFQEFDPWTLFITNKHVANRLVNYNLLRCRLNVKFMITGNGFYYGKAIAAYQPLPKVDSFQLNRGPFRQDIVQLSQMPHINIDPNTSQGGTMVLPFFYPSNNLTIPAEDRDQMGKICLRSLQLLKHANGSRQDITITVFAWMTDVTLSIPTSSVPSGITPQAGPVGTAEDGPDEYGDGVISTPATVVAKAAGALENAPVIGPYARATEMAASTVASVARAFGMSRPNNLCAAHPYQPKLLGNLANTNVDDTCQKLTYDGKAELTVDSRTMGLGGDDEMTIRSIAGRESFYRTFTWTETDISQHVLFSTVVTPVLWAESGTKPKTGYHLTASAAAALPFEYWRGTMKFRFQIAASSFHRGRLRISYDPYFVTGKDANYNTMYTYIVDISKDRDFTMEIGWAQPTSYVSHYGPGKDSLATTTSNGGLATIPGNKGNGVIQIAVQNTLTGVAAAVDVEPVYVNVWASAGDDFEVAGPTDRFIQNFTFHPLQTPPAGPPGSGGGGNGGINDDPLDVSRRGGRKLDERMADQAGELKSSGENDSKMTVAPGGEAREQDEPYQDPNVAVAKTDLPADHTDSVYFGDPITSIRQLFKRYNYYRTYVLSDKKVPTATQFTYQWTLPNFPLYRGYDPEGIDFVTLKNSAGMMKTVPYSVVSMTHMNWFTPCFAARRGGIRWKYFQYGKESITYDETMRITRKPDEEKTGYKLECTELDTKKTVGARAAAMIRTFDAGNSGMTVTTVGQNPVVEAEMPYYFPYRFTAARRKSPQYDNGNYHYLHGVELQKDKANKEYPMWDSYVAAGEDFTLAFYVGFPIVYYYANPDSGYIDV